MSGIISRDAGGSWISGRDHVIIKTTRTSGEGSDWHPAVGIKTSSGFWTFGSVGGEHLGFSYDTDTNYSTGNNTSTVISMPLKGGTIALTSDLSSYLPLSGGTMSISSGTIMSASYSTDILGYNPYYGTYIGGSSIGSGGYYLYSGNSSHSGGPCCSVGGTIKDIIHSGNISSQSVNYATSAGSATTANSLNRTPYSASGSTVGAIKAALKASNLPLKNGNWTTVDYWFIGNYGNDSASASGGGIYSVTTIGGYQGSDYNQFLVSCHSDMNIGVIGLAGGNWSQLRWLHYSDQKIANASYADSAGSVSWSNVTGGVCNSGQFCFSKIDDHAIQVGNIRGYGSNGQSGNYIHMYERVHIGSPSGWGSRSAPSYGLSTYGGCWLGTDTGNIGLGCTDPGYKLDVRGNARTTGRYYSNEWIEFNNATGLYFPNYYGGHFFPNVYTTYGNFVILGSKNGYTGIQFGSSTGNMTLMDSGSAKGIYQENWSWILLHEGDNTYLNANRFYSNSSGSYWNSDRSLKKHAKLVNKEDLSTLFNVSDKLIKKFIWKNTNKKTTYGFIAQEIERYVPEAVEVNPKTKKKSVNHNSAFSKIIASLIQEIKKQRKEIDQLKQEMKEMNK